MQLNLDQVNAKHLFSHGMLDLETRISLDKSKPRLFARLGLDQELKCSQAAIPHLARKTHGRRRQFVAQPFRQTRTGRDLHDFLMTPLDAAFTLPEMAHVARSVAGNLHFNMAGRRHNLLQIKIAIAEGGTRLRLAAGEGFIHLGLIANQTHTASAATMHSLDHDGCA